MRFSERLKTLGIAAMYVVFALLFALLTGRGYNLIVNFVGLGVILLPGIVLAIMAIWPSRGRKPRVEEDDNY